MEENELTLDALQELITQGTFHRWLGLRVLEVGAQGIVVGVPWREEFMVHPERRYVHGGILATAIDISADYALAARVGQPCPTVDLRVDYHRAAAPGELRVEARVVRLGGTMATAEAYVYDSGGALAASGRGVYFTGVLRKRARGGAGNG